MESKIEDTNKYIATYKGKRIDEMTREELIEALDFAIREIQQITEEKQRQRNFLFCIK